MPDKILPLHWNMIVERIDKGLCVPFLGAGVNAKYPGYEGLPLGGDVALRLLEEMLGMHAGTLADLPHAVRFQTLAGYRERTEDALRELAGLLRDAQQPYDPARLQEIIKSILPDDQDDLLAYVITNKNLEQYREFTRVALQDLARVALRYRWQAAEIDFFIAKLKTIIPDVERKPSALLRRLAALPFELIVTTNYDRLMERALELFVPDDLKDGGRLALKLRQDTQDPKSPATHLRESFSAEMLAALAAFDGAQPAPDSFRQSLVEEINLVIQEKSLYHLDDEELLRDLTDEDIKLEVAARPQSHLHVRRNRQLLEKTYPEEIAPHVKPYEVVVQPIKGFRGREQNDTRDTLADHDDLILYKLHGSFTDERLDDEDRRPVITEEDYIEFLTFIGGKGEGIDPLITAKIQDSTLLFLGYSLEDWNFRALFKGLIEKLMPSQMRLSFAIQKDPSDFWIKFWERKNVVIYNVDLHEFAEELEEKYRAYAAARGQAPAPVGLRRERGRVRRGR